MHQHENEPAPSLFRHQTGQTEMPRGVSLLLVDSELRARAWMAAMLARHAFDVTAVASCRAGLKRASEQEFDYSVFEMRLIDGHGIDLIGRLHALQPWTRIVIVTDVGSFASVVRALQAGAADYLGKPLIEADLLDALMDRRPSLPKIPDTPLGLRRVAWEYIQRMHEQCGRNVSETARRLGMHRRSLVRILSKRAPAARAT